MNCKQANEIPLSQVLKSMGCASLEKHSGGDEQWYENPLRDERTASFSINHKKNVWHDFGTGEGGNVIDLVTRHARKNVSGALEWLDSNLGNIPSINKQSFTELSKTETAARFKILKVQRLLHPLLLNYVSVRGVDKGIALRYLKEIHYLDTEKQKEYFGLGMENISGGYSIRNKYMKTNIAPLDIVNINPMDYSQNINVFEGFFDFLTYKTMCNDIEDKEQHIILNSTTMASRAAELVKKDINFAHQSIRLWFDNEKTGSKASQSVKRATEHFINLGCNIFSAQQNYSHFNDLNSYWMNTKELFNPKFSKIDSSGLDIEPSI